jgi:hypothetical protein
VHNSLEFAIPLAGILASLSLLHAFWALGGQWGTAYAVPVVRGRRSFNPTPLATWVVCGLLGGATILVIAASQRRLPLLDVGLWGLAAVFALRAIGNRRTFGFFKTISGSPFARWDTWLYSPLCVVIAVLAAGLARCSASTTISSPEQERAKVGALWTQTTLATDQAAAGPRGLG